MIILIRKIETKSTVKVASRRVPNNLVELWNTFLSEAFNASLSIDVVIFNDQRMSLQNSQMWCRNSQAAMVKGEPDIVRIGGSDPRILRSINANGINLLATVGINL
ncbi:unnamed protein product [Rhizophagus irregularis]|uniref:Uncharacterized protein n=1 Tax=Rhizophagus irregularis TaxID=588596 RepID=A0A915Z8H0_9GLOM|nr:unnamed protein product [Rhizophagus irregularis]